MLHQNCLCKSVSMPALVTSLLFMWQSSPQRQQVGLPCCLGIEGPGPGQQLNGLLVLGLEQLPCSAVGLQIILSFLLFFWSVVGFELKASCLLSFTTRVTPPALFGLGIFEIGGLVNYLPGLASNCDPPDLCLLSSWDYRCEPPVPSSLSFFNFRNQETGKLKVRVDLWG
jgi:hypothetical protein